jgi:hypothetical protein
MQEPELSFWLLRFPLMNQLRLHGRFRRDWLNWRDLRPGATLRAEGSNLGVIQDDLRAAKALTFRSGVAQAGTGLNSILVALGLIDGSLAPLLRTQIGMRIR